jgi:hypothetical protein
VDTVDPLTAASKASIEVRERVVVDDTFATRDLVATSLRQPVLSATPFIPDPARSAPA